MEPNNKEFIDGFYPKKSEVDFVKLKISIKVENFKKWFEQNSNEDWINIDIKKSKEGKLYAEKNNWKPNKVDESDQTTYFPET